MGLIFGTNAVPFQANKENAIYAIFQQADGGEIFVGESRDVEYHLGWTEVSRVERWGPSTTSQLRGSGGGSARIDVVPEITLTLPYYDRMVPDLETAVETGAVMKAVIEHVFIYKQDVYQSQVTVLADAAIASVKILDNVEGLPMVEVGMAYGSLISKYNTYDENGHLLHTSERAHNKLSPNMLEPSYTAKAMMEEWGVLDSRQREMLVSPFIYS